MPKQKPDPCDELLRQWQMRRELANYYMTALLRLSPDAPGALRRRQELNKKIFVAQLCLKQIDDQLQSCYIEHDLALAKRNPAASHYRVPRLPYERGDKHD